MFCTNCGQEVTGNFCAGCGTPVNSNSPTSVTPTIDPVFILNKNGGNKIAAVKEYCSLSGVSLDDGKSAIDYAAKNNNTTFAERLSAQVQGIQEVDSKKQAAKREVKEAEKERIAAIKASGQVYCPKCYSTSVTGNKKGFGIGKAVTGAALSFGSPLGLMAGNIGARKVRVTCMKCGHSWMAGK